MNPKHQEFFTKLEELCKEYSTSIYTHWYYHNDELFIDEACVCFLQDKLLYNGISVHAGKFEYYNTENF